MYRGFWLIPLATTGSIYPRVTLENPCTVHTFVFDMSKRVRSGPQDAILTRGPIPRAIHHQVKIRDAHTHKFGGHTQARSGPTTRDINQRAHSLPSKMTKSKLMRTSTESLTEVRIIEELVQFTTAVPVRFPVLVYRLCRIYGRAVPCDQKLPARRKHDSVLVRFEC